MNSAKLSGIDKILVSTAPAGFPQAKSKICFICFQAPIFAHGNTNYRSAG